MREKILGILGGMSWVSTLSYYRKINEGVSSRLGGQHSAPLLIASVDFQPIVRAQSRGDWDFMGDELASLALRLETAGAGAVMIASNTMHKVAESVTASLTVPLLSIFDCTARAIKDSGHNKAGLLGTRYTMSDEFFVREYAKRGIEIIVPEKENADAVNECIFRELIHNQMTDRATKLFDETSFRLMEKGAGGVILGCTEIGLLYSGREVTYPVFDTTELHTAMAIDWLCRNV